jgi:hypothetical protein
MATFGEYWSIPGLKATATLASYQYYIVKAETTAGGVKVATTAATDAVLGVLQNDPAAGEAADVAFAGIAKVLCEASTTYGSQLTVSTTGRAKTSTTDGDRCIGIALEAYSTAGGIIRVLLARHDIYLA